MLDTLPELTRDVSNGWFASPYDTATQAEIIDEITHRLAQGELLASIVKDAHMPAWSTVYAWRDSNPDTVERFRYAREAGEESIVLKAQRIVDGLEPVEGVPSDPTRDKARADVRLKILAKMNPKRWGDSTQLRHADADGAKLDTAPLVGELLSLMGGSAPVTTAQPVAGYRDVTPATPIAHTPTQPAQPVYRPRAARQDVDDLV